MLLFIILSSFDSIFLNINSLLTSFLLINILWNFVSYDGSFYLCFTLLFSVYIPFSYCPYMSLSPPFLILLFSISFSPFLYFSLSSFFSFNYSLSLSLLFSTSQIFSLAWAWSLKNSIQKKIHFATNLIKTKKELRLSSNKMFSYKYV